MNPHPHPSPSPYPHPAAPQQHQQHPHHPQQHQDYAQTAAAALSSAPPQQLPPVSQQHVPTPNNTAAPNGRKRKAGQPGSRGVANLTPEQLAKKRANDREAQRAIRERTKNTIEGLEARIRELESQQPYQELQRALADRDRALQECEELKTRLAAVAGIVGNRELGQTGLNELAALTAQQSPLPSTAAHTPAQYPQQQPTPGQKYEHPPPQQHLHPDLRSPNNSSTTGSPAGAPPHYSGSEATPARKWSPSSESQAPPRPQFLSHANAYEQQRSAPPAQMHQQHQQSESNGERLGLSFLLEQQHTSPLANTKSGVPTSGVPTSDPAMAVISHHLMTCPLDYILGDFVKSHRQQIASGIPVSQFILEKPSLMSMTSPNTKRSPADRLTPLLVDVLSKFPDIDNDPERLGVLYGMYYLTRWFVCPCEACLERCPQWTLPILESKEHNHAIWIDYLPWPSMRRKLVLARTSGTTINFDDFFVTFTNTMSVNWPHPPMSQEHPVLLNVPGRTPDEPPTIELSREFVQHICDLDNWSVGPEFVHNFPELVDESVRVVDRRKAR